MKKSTVTEGEWGTKIELDTGTDTSIHSNMHSKIKCAFFSFLLIFKEIINVNYTSNFKSIMCISDIYNYNSILQV